VVGSQALLKGSKENKITESDIEILELVFHKLPAVAQQIVTRPVGSKWLGVTVANKALSGPCVLRHSSYDVPLPSCCTVCFFKNPASFSLPACQQLATWGNPICCLLYNINIYINELKNYIELKKKLSMKIIWQKQTEPNGRMA
jgi:hypothetical protein